MDKLPPEILDILCSYFSIHELETTIAKISRSFTTTAEAAINSRVAKLDKILSPAESQEVITQFIPPNPTRLMILKKFESLVSVNGFELLRLAEDYDKTTMNALFNSLYDEDVLIVYESVKFIHCYQLLVVLADDNLFFVNESSLFENGEYLSPMQNSRPFLHHIQSSRGMYTINLTSSGTLMMDVYHDHIIICRENRRSPILYKIIAVCHSSRSITLNLVRRIFLPTTIEALSLYREKVIVQYSTGEIGIWQHGNNIAELEFSQERLSPMVWMLRINHLIILRSSLNTYDLMDAEMDGVAITRIPFIEILLSIFPFGDDFDYKEAEVQHICITGNMLLVQILAPHAAYDSEACPYKLNLLCALKLRRSPVKEDFVTVNQFQQLMNVEDSKFYDNLSTAMLMIPPAIVPGRGEMQKRVKASLVTISPGCGVGVMDIVECPTNVGPEYIPVEMYSGQSEWE